MSSISDELSALDRSIGATDDLQELARVQARLQTLRANIEAGLASEKDDGVRQFLTSLRDQAIDIETAAKQRLADVKVARMDPAYEQHKSEAAAKALAETQKRKTEELEKAKQFLNARGLGGLFGGMLAAAGGAAPAAGGAACAKCSAPVGASKFCPQCGAPVPQERHCSKCSVKLEAAAKFCGECGTPA
jgi:double zinc ribbon protein